MKQYQNKSRKSGVRAYESGEDYIKVWFVHTEKPYLYNSVRPGKRIVEAMKKLATNGKGLSTYISKYVQENYYE